MREQFENEMKLEFLSKSSNEAFARITVAAFASQLDPTIEELADIKTAVSEAVTNCIIHGYENRIGVVKIYACLLENEIKIEISDNGKGIENIEMAKEPLYTTKPNLERSGMGFTIMESFMDFMEVESIVGIGTKITMKKKIKKPAIMHGCKIKDIPFEKGRRAISVGKALCPSVRYSRCYLIDSRRSLNLLRHRR